VFISWVVVVLVVCCAEIVFLHFAIFFLSVAKIELNYIEVSLKELKRLKFVHFIITLINLKKG